MIVTTVRDPLLRASLLRAARPDEDVVSDPAMAGEALAHGFPRVVVHLAEEGGQLRPPSETDGATPVVTITRAELRRWDSIRRAREIPPPRVEHVGSMVGARLDRACRSPRWVDRTLADLARISGAPLPQPFRGLARRVLEFPSRYTDVGPVAEAGGLSAGALKARFRRRGLESPYSYLRWLRVLAAAHVLADPSVTTGAAAVRLGYSHGGNFCRSVETTSGMSPTELRTSRLRVLVRFARLFLDAETARRWEGLEELFLRDAG